MKLLHSISLATLQALTFGCDSSSEGSSNPTVNVQLDSVYISGACRAEETTGALTSAETSGELDISVVLIGQTDQAQSAILPTMLVREERDSVENLIKQSGALRFALPQTAVYDVPGIMTSALATKDSAPREARELAISFNQIDFEYAGGEAAKDLDPYIILLMDQSASLIGKSSDSEVDIAQATDRYDQRISFFGELIQSLPDNYRVTVMAFSESSADDSQENLTLPSENAPLPSRLGDTLNGVPYRETIGSYLENLKSKNNLKIGTPLTEALKKAHDLARDAKGALRPIVVLFTDGLEDGDSSSNAKSPEELSTLYSSIDVPVHVMHLQPPPSVPNSNSRGRNKSFAALSCSTGGDYLFVESPDEFSKGNRFLQTLSGRLSGRWALKAATDLGDSAFASPQGYLISTDISVTLGNITRVYSASRSLDEADSVDQSMWVYKP